MGKNSFFFVLLCIWNSLLKVPHSYILPPFNPLALPIFPICFIRFDFYVGILLITKRELFLKVCWAEPSSSESGLNVRGWRNTQCFLEFKTTENGLFMCSPFPSKTEERMKHLHSKLGCNIHYFHELFFFPFLQPACLVSSNLACAISWGTWPLLSKPSLSKGRFCRL